MLGVVEAEAISWNDSGTVVGSALTSQGRRFAFVWDEASGMSDLNRSASDATTLQLQEAVSIDDSGRIIVKGLSNGEDAEFELSPTHSAKAPTSRGLCGSFSGLEAAGGALGLIFMSALSLTRRRRRVSRPARGRGRRVRSSPGSGPTPGCPPAAPCNGCATRSPRHTRTRSTSSARSEANRAKDRLVGHSPDHVDLSVGLLSAGLLSAGLLSAGLLSAGLRDRSVYLVPMP